jgi:signal transduction histidine kinase
MDKNTILIIDDEVQNIKALVNILNADYEVLVTADSREAIEIAETNKPDIILLDVVMPIMDGHEVIHALKDSEKTRKIPVIFITGLDSIKDEEQGLLLGAVDYISKPFNPVIVKLRVQNQLKIEERNELKRQLELIQKLEAGLIAAKEQAEHLSSVKSEFLSRMSHEMRTPMAAIMGMSQVARMTKADEFFDELDAASRQLLGMIDEVLDLSDMEYGLFKLSQTQFNFNEMLREIIKTVGYNSAKKHQSLDFEVDKAIPDILTGDEKRLKQVITSLLINAVKFTPEDGKIQFNASVIDNSDGYVTLQIEVIDDGIGISKDKQDGIFNVFEQADGGNTREHSGIGIGLALAKRIVEMMNGEIWVESVPNEGAKFSFTCKIAKS